MSRKDKGAAPSDSQKKQDDFRRYFAGQSVMKSGLTRDPKEVERIIAEASVNSKFYMREQEKDRVLGKKIEELVKLKDKMVRQANMNKLEREADDCLTELESTRDLTQIIVHVDMDAFYANVEVKKDPSLKGIPFGVGSGVLTTASYEARKYGCRSGMAGFVAKKLCPKIRFVKPDFAAYSEASKNVREVLLEFDENLAMAGMDEGYLNITPYMSLHDMTASEVVTKLRAEVEARTGLTISAGIAPNTMLAKICSDKNKPNGQYELEFQGKAIRQFMSDLPIRRIPGIGRVAERYAKALGVNVCGDIYQHRGVINLMDRHVGFKFMMKAYLGLGNTVVEPGKREDRKSVGCERTFRDKSQDAEILQLLSDIVTNLEEDMKRTGFAGRTVVVKYKLHTYEVFTRQCGVPKYIDKAEDILPVARSLLIKELPLKIRLLGVRMTHLKDLQSEAADKHGIQKYFKESPTKRGSANPIASLKPPMRTRLNDDYDDDDEPVLIDSDDSNERHIITLPSSPPEYNKPQTTKKGSRTSHIKSPKPPPVIGKRASALAGDYSDSGSENEFKVLSSDEEEEEIEVLCPNCQMPYARNPGDLCQNHDRNSRVKPRLEKPKPQKFHFIKKTPSSSSSSISKRKRPFKPLSPIRSKKQKEDEEFEIL